MKKLCFVAGFLLLSLSVLKAQDPDIILVDKFYATTFDRVLDDIATENHLTFDYDRDVLAGFELNERPIKKPLRVFLDQECGQFRLKWQQTPDKIIHITSKYEDLTSKPQAPKVVRTYTGQAKKSKMKIKMGGGKKSEI